MYTVLTQIYRRDLFVTNLFSVKVILDLIKGFMDIKIKTYNI